jgi:hypothetical protein
MTVGIRCTDDVTPSTRRSRHCFAVRGRRSVGIARLRIKKPRSLFSNFDIYCNLRTGSDAWPTGWVTLLWRSPFANVAGYLDTRSPAMQQQSPTVVLVQAAHLPACDSSKWRLLLGYLHTLCIYRRLVVSACMFKVVRFEVFTAVTMKNCVFWDVTPCGSCMNRRLGGT